MPDNRYEDESKVIPVRVGNNDMQCDFGQRTDELLNKALETGQISMIDYFVEITLLYDSMQNYLDVEKEYQNAVAQLLQYQL